MTVDVLFANPRPGGAEREESTVYRKDVQPRPTDESPIRTPDDSPDL